MTFLLLKTHLIFCFWMQSSFFTVVQTMSYHFWTPPSGCFLTEQELIHFRPLAPHLLHTCKLVCVCVRYTTPTISTSSPSTNSSTCHKHGSNPLRMKMLSSSNYIWIRKSKGDFENFLFIICSLNGTCNSWLFLLSQATAVPWFPSHHTLLDWRCFSGYFFSIFACWFSPLNVF